MVAERIVYTCEICQSEFGNAEDAISCERNHREIQHADYVLHNYRKGEPVPDHIEVSCNYKDRTVIANYVLNQSPHTKYR